MIQEGNKNVFRAFYSIQNANSLIWSHGEIDNILTIQITYYIEWKTVIEKTDIFEKWKHESSL